MAKSKIRHLFDGIRHSLDGAIISQNANWCLSTVLRPLHLSRTLYKSATFYAKQTQFPKSQMNVNPYNTTDYENKSNWTLGENKPNSNPIKANFKRAKMNVNSTLTKGYRKKDDFAVQKNKANFRKAQNERKYLYHKGL